MTHLTPSKEISIGVPTVDALLREAKEHSEAATRHYGKAMADLEAEKPATKPFLMTIIEQNAANQCTIQALMIAVAALTAATLEATGMSLAQIKAGEEPAN